MRSSNRPTCRRPSLAAGAAALRLFRCVLAANARNLTICGSHAGLQPLGGGLLGFLGFAVGSLLTFGHGGILRNCSTQSDTTILQHAQQGWDAESARFGLGQCTSSARSRANASNRTATRMSANSASGVALVAMRRYCAARANNCVEDKSRSNGLDSSDGSLSCCTSPSFCTQGDGGAHASLCRRQSWVSFPSTIN